MTRLAPWTACVVLIPFFALAAGAQQGQQGQVWDLGTQQSGRVFPTEVSAVNRNCRGARDFQLSIEGEIARFLSITGPTELRGVRRGETRTTPARLDLTNAPAGSYEGLLVSRCTNCPATCNLDYSTITVLLSVRVPPGVAQSQAPAAASAPPAGAIDPDPNNDCAFVPRIETEWESTAGGPGIVERDGAHVVDLSPGSTFWGVERSIARTADTTWKQTSTTRTDDTTWKSSTEMTRQADTTWDLATQTRELCLEHLAPCAELLAKVRAAEEAWRLAEARARDATAREQYDQAEAAALDEETARERAYAATLRRQAADWRKLAGDARADAATNRRRAERQPDYADSWIHEAARDEARAAERDAKAKGLEDEAARIEARIRDKTDAADAARGRADAARQAAAAAKQALDLARAEYEACLERQRLECERERREAILTARRAQAASAATATSTSSGGGSATSSGGSTPGSGPQPQRGRYGNFESLPVQTAPFCQWVRFNVPYGESVQNVRVVRTGPRDTPSALEVREMQSGSTSTGRGFEYHCKAPTGTAVILFEQVSGEVKRYKLRVGCVAE